MVRDSLTISIHVRTERSAPARCCCLARIVWSPSGSLVGRLDNYTLARCSAARLVGWSACWLAGTVSTARSAAFRCYVTNLSEIS